MIENLGNDYNSIIALANESIEKDDRTKPKYIITKETPSHVYDGSLVEYITIIVPLAGYRNKFMLTSSHIGNKLFKDAVFSYFTYEYTNLISKDKDVFQLIKDLPEYDLPENQLTTIEQSKLKSVGLGNIERLLKYTHEDIETILYGLYEEHAGRILSVILKIRNSLLSSSLKSKKQPAKTIKKEVTKAKENTSAEDNNSLVENEVQEDNNQEG